MLDPAILSDQDLIDTYRLYLPTIFADVEDIDPTVLQEKRRVAMLHAEIEARGYRIEFQDSGPPVWRSPQPSRPDITESEPGTPPKDIAT